MPIRKGIPRKGGIVRKTAIKKRAEGTITIDPENIAQAALTYASLQKTYASVNKDMAACRKVLNAFVEKNGKKDGKGNLHVTVKYGAQSIELAQIARSTVVPLPEAIDIIRAKFPKSVQKKLIETAEYVVDNTRIEELILTGVITEEQAKEFLAVSTTYAFKAPKVKR